MTDEPLFYLIPLILVPGVLSNVWPAFGRWLDYITLYWIAPGLVVGVGLYFAWLLWGPRPQLQPRDEDDQARAGRG